MPTATKPLIVKPKAPAITVKKAAIQLPSGFAHTKFWNLYKHGLTASSIEKWLSCHEQFRLTYVEGWSSHNVSMAIEFGSCVHWVLEQVYQKGNTEFPTPKEVELLVLDYQQYWEKLVQAPTATQLEQQEMVYALAEATLPSYFRRYNGDLTGNYNFKLEGVDAPVKWVKLEEVFKYDYKMPDGRIIPLRGRKDGTFLNKKDQLFVFDTKTKGQINEETIAAMLPVHFQMMLYLWIEAQQSEIYPRGVQLNIYRRPLLRRGKEESLPDFALRVKTDCSQQSRFDHYFTRLQMVITKSEINHWHDTTLLPILTAIQQWYHGISPHYATHAALGTYGPCDTFGMILNGDQTGLYKRRHVFPELPEVN